MGGRKDSTPIGTPRPVPKRETSNQENEQIAAASIPRDGTYAVDSTLSKFPFVLRWEATGVMNDIPSKAPVEAEPGSVETAKRPGMQRTVSRQAAQRAQFDAKQKLADAMDTARAAELALRELVGSWRAAKYVFFSLFAR
jgi:hypothetical protein